MHHLQATARPSDQAKPPSESNRPEVRRAVNIRPSASRQAFAAEESLGSWDVAGVGMRLKILLLLYIESCCCGRSVLVQIQIRSTRRTYKVRIRSCSYSVAFPAKFGDIDHAKWVRWPVSRDILTSSHLHICTTS